MKTNVYDEIRRVKDLHDKEVRDISQKLKAAEAEKDECESKAAAALDNGKVEEYMNARSSVRAATDKVDYYNNRINKLKSDPIFSNDERKEKAAAVRSNVEAVKDKDLTAALKRVKEAYSILDELVLWMQEGNDVLETLDTNSKTTLKKFDILPIVQLRNSMDFSQKPLVNQYWK